MRPLALCLAALMLTVPVQAKRKPITYTYSPNEQKLIPVEVGKPNVYKPIKIKRTKVKFKTSTKVSQ
jgi:hypothetical protein